MLRRFGGWYTRFPTHFLTSIATITVRGGLKWTTYSAKALTWAAARFGTTCGNTFPPWGFAETNKGGWTNGCNSATTCFGIRTCARLTSLSRFGYSTPFGCHTGT